MSKEYQEICQMLEPEELLWFPLVRSMWLRLTDDFGRVRSFPELGLCRELAKSKASPPVEDREALFETLGAPITLQEVVDKLIDARRVLAYSSDESRWPCVFYTVKITVYTLTGDPENEFLRLEWSDMNEGVDYVAYFSEEPNGRPLWIEAQALLRLIDTDGSECLLHIQ